ncbi:hypothetical protein PR202_ga17678 [Eleusine coracana subsp. coracana]|uniref:Uncharacterized protein n=1 Tax=Eleusine coracana subsp. coracana TaxID=191504 RepID=A0AAV5CRJ1_ELECO|nr:hypothetical protein PR202_ga17431 [Eleusine coracana subsp. coracana]GJN00492.1 hypothetical protein PR202_ga17678 [Eleusine coracana subsp. coracana]
MSQGLFIVFTFRLLSSAVSTISPKPFAINGYLVDSCGLTKVQALKAPKKLAHHQTSSKPNVVLSFLAGLDLPRFDIATVVAYDPRILCASVEETLASGQRISAGSACHVSRSRASSHSLVTPSAITMLTSGLRSLAPSISFYGPSG